MKDKTLSGALRIQRRFPGKDWCICAIGQHKVTGEVPEGIQDGDHVTLEGWWKEDSRWGPEFKFTTIVCERPVDASGIAAYLARHIPWIQEATADKIVSTFGAEDTFRILGNAIFTGLD